MSKPEKPEITKEWINAYFSYGVNPEGRSVHLYGDVDNETISNVIKSIYYLDSLSDEPIELFIGSFGGSVYDMFGLYDVLNTTNCPIHTIGMGMVMSAAVLLVAAGKKGHRYSMPHCSYMVHEGHSGLSDGRLASHIKSIEHYKALDKAWYMLMDKHTNLNAAAWKKKCNPIGDHYFNADQAIEYGIADHLWSEK